MSFISPYQDSGINKIIQAYSDDHDAVFCYGAGLYGKIVGAFLLENDISMEGYIVSDDVEPDMSVLGLPLYSAKEKLPKLKNNSGVIVAVNENLQSDIVSFLEKNNITDYLCIKNTWIPILRDSCDFTRRYESMNNITVICYHRVANIPIDTWKLAVKPELFEDQIRYLKENYLILRSDEEWNIAEGKRAAIITFDDGYEDSYTELLPILEKYQVPATVFVATCNLDSNKEFWWDELERIISFANESVTKIRRFGLDIPIASACEKEKACYQIHPYLKKMDHKERDKWLRKLADELDASKERSYCHSLTSLQLRELSNSPLITIGGHTITHSSLAMETLDEQRWEIVESKKVIESIIRKPIEVFSYPFGQKSDFSDETVEVAIKAGFKKVFAAYDGIANSQYKNGYIPRINIGQELELDASIRLLNYYETIY